LYLAPAPPDPPTIDPEEDAVRQRMADWAVRDARRWQEEKGDLGIPWEQADGHLAIVIDDVGRELRHHEGLQALRFPLTFSVLPGARYASGAQDRLAADTRRPRELWLHLPMEPLGAEQMHEGDESNEAFLLATDEPRALVAKLDAALARVPGAVGVNNHMGSRLTADREAMRALMPELGRRDLLFLDSRTTAETVAEQSAREFGVRVASRHVFLDHDPDPHAIEAALEEAAARSRREPTIVIGHPSAAVVAVLGEQLPRLHREGVAVYPLSTVMSRSRAVTARRSTGSRETDAQGDSKEREADELTARTSTQ
jgi:polysaccharide deacetylase 2 family uncharacterized protein YibQ